MEKFRTQSDEIVYLLSTYFLSDLIIGLNITRT